MDTSITEATTELSKSQELKIEEVYRIGKEWNDVLRVLGLEPNCVLAKNRATELPFSYVQQAGLDQGVPDRKHIVLDKILGDALFQGALKRNERIPEYLPKAQLSNIALNRMHRQYCITRGTQQVLQNKSKDNIRSFRRLRKERCLMFKFVKLNEQETNLRQPSQESRHSWSILQNSQRCYKNASLAQHLYTKRFIRALKNMLFISKEGR